MLLLIKPSPINLRRPSVDVILFLFYPLEKNSELDDPEEAVVVWYDLCLKQSNDIRGGDTATVTDDDDWAPESGGDPTL